MNHRISFRIGFGWLSLLVCLSAHAETVWDPAGYWTGQLGYRGDDLEVRVHVQREGGQTNGRLDIPALVYANQPVAITYDDKQSLSF